MKTRTLIYVNVFALLAVGLAALLIPASVLGQEQPAARFSIELGARGVTGEVDGRPELPFVPSLTQGKFNEYRDLKNGFFVRSFQAQLGGMKNYFNLQSQSSLYRDQSWLGTVGQYGLYKLQFRYDETPHTYTNTARTLYTQTTPGVWTLATATRTALGGFYSAIGTATQAKLTTALNNFNSVLNSSASLVDASLVRKTGTLTASVNPLAGLTVAFLYSREQQNGLRPIGVSIQGGNAEVPEAIDYTTQNYRATVEYGREKWAARFSYQGTTFDNNTHCQGSSGFSCLAVDNPLAIADSASPNAAKTGKLSLYPDNRADNFSFAGGVDVTSKLHVTASITPGWWSQNAPLMAYTTNTARATPAWGVLPETSADAKKQTLAMNYTITSRITKSLQVKASYRSYDSSNDTPEASFYPVTLDGAFAATRPATATLNSAFGFNRKTAELSATWFFTQKNSVKVGYEFETMDREERSVSHQQENSLVTALDLNPRKDLLVRVSYRHGDRFGERFAYETTDPNYAVARVVDTRRFDEAPRLRDRAEALVQYSPTQRLTVGASFGTTQDNYNRRIGSEAAAANPFPALGAFYTYGLLKDIGRTFTFDGTYALTNNVSWFGEYTREKYNTKMSLLANANLLNGVPINAYANSNDDVVDTWASGLDVALTKKVSFTTTYSLSAGKGNMLNSPINCALTFAQCRTLTGWSLDTAALPLITMNYPETVTRLHQVEAQVKFKLTKSLTPKFEYRFEQFNNRDFQTGVMNPYMPSLQDTSNNNWLFLGADNPSYHAHVIAASLQYTF